MSQAFGDNWLTEAQARTILRKMRTIPPSDDRDEQISKFVDDLFDSVQRCTVSDLLGFAFMQWHQNQAN